jgi:hypothetical protein
MKKPMSRWKMFTLLNVSGVVGCCIAMFTLPPSTPVWRWGLISVLCLAIFNYGFWRKLTRPKREEVPPSRFDGLVHTFLIIIGLLIMAEQIYENYFR